MYLLTTFWRGAAHVDTMRCFDNIEDAYEYWKVIRKDQASSSPPHWWQQHTSNVRAWEVSADKPPKLVTKYLEKMLEEEFGP